MDMAAEMLQLPQFGLVERRTKAELTHRAIDAGLLLVWRDRNQGNLHAPLQNGLGSNHIERQACRRMAS